MKTVVYCCLVLWLYTCDSWTLLTSHHLIVVTLTNQNCKDHEGFCRFLSRFCVRILVSWGGGLNLTTITHHYTFILLSPFGKLRTSNKMVVYHRIYLFPINIHLRTSIPSTSNAWKHLSSDKVHPAYFAIFKEIVTNYPKYISGGWSSDIISHEIQRSSNQPSPRQDISTPPRYSEPPMPCWASASRRTTPRVEPRERVARRREMGRL